MTNFFILLPKVKKKRGSNVTKTLHAKEIGQSLVQCYGENASPNPPPAFPSDSGPRLCNSVSFVRPLKIKNKNKTNCLERPVRACVRLEHAQRNQETSWQACRHKHRHRFRPSQSICSEWSLPSGHLELEDRPRRNRQKRREDKRSAPTDHGDREITDVDRGTKLGQKK